jgi:putative glutamine amidotransferase
VTTVGIVVGHVRGDLAIPRPYVDAVLAAGGTPLLVPATLGDDERLDRVLGHTEALLLAGGGDIDPERYGAKPAATLHALDRLRDEVEVRALRWAMAAGVRVLGICRGAQLMAAATGGRLVQDLPAAGFDLHIETEHDRGYAGLRHAVKAERGSLAERVLGGLSEVNSEHHQAVADPGDVLVPSAWSPDGAIEAIEGPGLFGVQWHPEFEYGADGRHLRPFQWLVEGERGVAL